MLVKHIGPRFSPLRKKDVDMTEGNILRHIISFAIPLLIGNLFQQFYNMVDTWVVGNYVSNEAYAAVGTVGPIFNTLISWFTGLASGAGVVISQYYGAGQKDRVHDTVHTAILVTIIMGILLSIIGIVITPFMLSLMNTPENVFPQASAYLMIIFSGILGLTFYNMGAGILRAVGDSQRPFYFLAICAVINIVLDLVFVLVFGMGVQGVALATILAQLTSAILVVITLLRTDSCIKMTPKDLKIHWDIFKKILKIGIPAALQMAITSFSNIFVQSYINYFGDNCISGWTTYGKVDEFLFPPMQSIALAVTTFVGQNLGKNQIERAKKGVTRALFLAIGSTITVMIPVWIFAEPIVAFFNSKPEVVEYGSMFLRWITPFCVICCFNQIYASALRGAGISRVPMFIVLGSFVVFRQLYLFIVSHISNEVIPIVMGYPAGWLLCSTLCTIYFYKAKLDKTSLVHNSQ